MRVLVVVMVFSFRLWLLIRAQPRPGKKRGQRLPEGTPGKLRRDDKSVSAANAAGKFPGAVAADTTGRQMRPSTPATTDEQGHSPTTPPANHTDRSAISMG